VLLSTKPNSCPNISPGTRYQRLLLNSTLSRDFFEELTKQLANRVFESLEQIEKALTFFLLQWKEKKNEIIKLTTFTYMRHA